MTANSIVRMSSKKVAEKVAEQAGWRLWKRIGCPKYVVAPMVHQSELAFRMLTRKYDSQLCFTPMIHSRLFVESEKYRESNFHTCPEDRPLFVQFCGDNEHTLLKAAKYVEDKCDAVDLNLGTSIVIEVVSQCSHNNTYKPKHRMSSRYRS